MSLRPFQALDDDYYAGGAWRDEDSDEEMSSDDELQQELRKLAGIQKCDKKKEEKTDFENDMENELDTSMCDYAEEHMGVKESPKKAIEGVGSGNGVKMETEEVCAASSSKIEAEEEEEEENPIKKQAKKAAKEVKQEEVEFYDPTEDDENEKWVAERSSRAKGGEKQPVNAKGKIDNDSDAVLSCPGCMNLLTRDCQRHEIYKDQYRAMFVENCVVDEAEKLTIEKTGKEKRRQRQMLKKRGLPAEAGATDNDIFLPVRCRICSTKVAVVDSDDVYHFFNVLSGYA